MVEGREEIGELRGTAGSAFLFLLWLHRAGSSVAERGSATAEAWVQIPVGASWESFPPTAVVTQWQSSGLPNRQRGFDSLSLHSSLLRASGPLPDARYAAVAQRAEHRPRNSVVAGSTPACGSRNSQERSSKAERRPHKPQGVGSNPATPMWESSYSGIVQLAERPILNREVEGSSPSPWAFPRWRPRVGSPARSI
jgi:hypothetical protein